MKWDTTQYLKFSSYREQPAIELIQHISMEAPKVIYDLGCGTGNVTNKLAQRWPSAQITGIDLSPQMLAVAKKTTGPIDWVLADIATWQPEISPDLLVSNAALHWLDDHVQLFPKLFSYLKPGGIFAVQMPANFNNPSHVCMEKVIESAPWKNKVKSLLRNPILDLEKYYDLLLPHAAWVQLWETTYYCVLRGENPVVEWVKGTWLKQFLDRLEANEQAEFIHTYTQMLQEFYPKKSDGSTLFSFRRFFILAERV